MMSFRNRGVLAALGAALLFGASTPAAKAALGDIHPLLMAGILYLGSGIGLALFRALRPGDANTLPPAQLKWLAAAIFFGGVVAPGLLMWGLSRMPASEVALLLNLESLFTALLAWFVFKENFDSRIAIGMALIVGGAVVLAAPTYGRAVDPLPLFAVSGACLAWALDNNLTRKASLGDATTIAMTKGLVAGSTNLLLAFLAGAVVPTVQTVAAGTAIGFLGYGVSLALFVVGLRELGAGRAGAYFSTAPFAGALIAVAFLDEPVNMPIVVAGLLMAAGVWLHLTERHKHTHTHAETDHEHEHTHDMHHDHAHGTAVPPGTRHSHPHHHGVMTHDHPHYPDEHHRHKH